MKQKDRLLNYLQINRKIDPLVSWRTLGIYRLSDAILQLRKDGHNIATTRVKVKNRYGEDCRVAEYRYLGEK